MALHGGIALDIDLTRSTKAVGSRGICGFSRGHERDALSAPFLDVGDSRRSAPDASHFSSVDGTD